MQNVSKLEGITSSDLEGLSKMYDLGDHAMKNRMLAIMGGRTDLTRMIKLEYFLEQASPVTVGYTTVETMFRDWAAGVKNLGLTDPWETWMQEKHKDQKYAQGQKIIDSYDAQDRAQYLLHFQGGQVLQADNSPIPRRTIFALSASNEWYAKPNTGEDDDNLHHSSFLQGVPVKCAGELFVDNGGNLTKITNNSGHYQPDMLSLQRAVAVLKAQMADTSAVQVKLVGKPTVYTVDNFLNL